MGNTHYVCEYNLQNFFNLFSASSVEPCSEAARRRLLNEFKTLQNESDHHDDSFFCTSPYENDIMKWNAVIFGTDGFIHEKGIFKLVMTFCHKYPHMPPQIKFLSSLFHPNVSPDGTVCPKALQRDWSSATTVVGILKSLRSLLDNPCLDNDTNYNPRATNLFQMNKLKYTLYVKDCVNKSLDVDNRNTGEVTSSKESYQILGKGGVQGGFSGGDAMAYKLTLPPNFPYGIEPKTITENSTALNTTLDYFYKAIEIMASESQVLILISSQFLETGYANVLSLIVKQLEKDSYIAHPYVCQDTHFHPENEEAAKWVRAHSPQIKKKITSCGGEQKKKYLIGHWYSSAGYEVPAVIFVTDDPENLSNATFCQRAKAKLVIYHLSDPDLNEYNNTLYRKIRKGLI